MIILDKDVNYIVSGLERSGTSMLMQMLEAGGVPTSFNNDSRPSDDSNPKGYFELEGGKIINKLMEGTFPFDRYKGKFIKITAYGLKFLPAGEYKVIYSERNIEQILNSMEKMARIHDENREETRESFLKLNEMIKDKMRGREDIKVLMVNYNDILSDPENNIRKIYDFLGSQAFAMEKMIKSVDQSLYRNR